MPPTCTLTTSHRLNVTARFAIRVAKKVAGAKVPKIAKSSAKPIVRRNALREDALDRSLGSAVTW